MTYNELLRTAGDIDRINLNHSGKDALIWKITVS